MKIAIVHEMLIKLGGAEKVLSELISLYPNADVFTLMYDEKKVGSVFLPEKIHCTGPAQWFFRFTGKPRASLPLMPFSIRMIDVSGYDLVISSSSGFAHGVKQRGTLNVERGTLFVCYCHSPARYLWDATEEVQREIGIPNEQCTMNNVQGRISSFIKKIAIRPLVQLLFWWLRRVDLRASKSPDIYVANSREVQKRIQKYYGRDSIVIWPPVETYRFIQMKNEEGPVLRSNKKGEGNTTKDERMKNGGFEKNKSDLCTMHSDCALKSTCTYYVITSALTPFKRLDVPIRVLSQLDIPLKIIGSGDQREELEKLAGKSIQFMGRLSDEEIVETYKNARGFLMPQKEDAGIAPIEAMAAGIPVFGLAQGGLLETNIDGVTGRFFQEETDESFKKSFLLFHEEIQAGKYDDPMPLMNQASKFDREKFRIEFVETVGRVYGEVSE